MLNKGRVHPSKKITRAGDFEGDLFVTGILGTIIIPSFLIWLRHLNGFWRQA